MGQHLARVRETREFFFFFFSLFLQREKTSRDTSSELQELLPPGAVSLRHRLSRAPHTHLGTGPSFLLPSLVLIFRERAGGPLLGARCSVLLCSVLSALCSVFCAPCSVLHVSCSVLCAPCSVLRVLFFLCPLLHIVFSSCSCVSLSQCSCLSPTTCLSVYRHPNPPPYFPTHFHSLYLSFSVLQLHCTVLLSPHPPPHPIPHFSTNALSQTECPLATPHHLIGGFVGRCT